MNIYEVIQLHAILIFVSHISLLVSVKLNVGQHIPQYYTSIIDGRVRGNLQVTITKLDVVNSFID